MFTNVFFVDAALQFLDVGFSAGPEREQGWQVRFIFERGGVHAYFMQFSFRNGVLQVLSSIFEMRSKGGDGHVGVEDVEGLPFAA